MISIILDLLSFFLTTWNDFYLAILGIFCTCCSFILVKRLA